MTAMIVGAFGFVLIMEGLVYALSPAKLKQMAAVILHIRDEQLRAGGLFAIGVGLLAVYFARAFLAGC